MHTADLSHIGEFKVLFSEGENWRVGVYRPQVTSVDEIKELEQHSCPESFLLLQGSITLVFKDSAGVLQYKSLRPLELTTLTEPHAGFSPNKDGVALVVESARLETVYTDIRTYEETRRVKVD